MSSPHLDDLNYACVYVETDQDRRRPQQRVLSAALGSSWRANFTSFDAIPFAAASLGQVHTGILAASVSPTGVDENVAVKVQFPDIVKSVESDLGYLKVLLGAGRMLPKGLFLDKTIKVCLPRCCAS